VLYYDGQFDDARLAIAIARTAAAHGAILLNYVRCIGFEKAESPTSVDSSHRLDPRVTGLCVTDQETGAEHTIHARAIINATGVFVDELRRQDQPTASSLVRPSQGIHIVLPREFLPGD